MTDGKNQTTRWNYDEYGRVTNKLDQAGMEILRYKYDPDGHLTNRWSAAKADTKYQYDPVGNLTNIDYAVSPDVNFTYDALNRVTTMVDAVGTTTYGYTVAGQLVTEDGPFAHDTVTNTYNNRLRTGLSLTQPTGSWTNGFGYDAAKRLTNVTSQAGAFGYQYPNNQPSTLIQKLALPNTSYITNIYDNVARLTGTWLNKNNGTTLDAATYGYNTGNQRTAYTNAPGAFIGYTYDSIGQLKTADSVTNAEDVSYAYDAAWNLNHRTNDGALSTFIVDGKNQLTNAFSATFSYDGNGNLTNANGGHNAYVYDDENRLVQWYYYQAGTPGTNGDLAATFNYDGLGRLRQRIEYVYSAGLGDWLPTNQVSYIYDGRRVIQERDGDNTPLVSYTRGNDLSGNLEGAGGIGSLLGRTDADGSTFYHADGNGNVTYLVDDAQALAASYRYDPYGNLLSWSGDLAAANVYRFSSKEIHEASGMYYYGHRFYEPNLQRWPNRDPIGEEGGINLYGYVGNRPINLVDLDGLIGWGFTGGAGMGGGVGAGFTAGASAGFGLFLGPNPNGSLGSLGGYYSYGWTSAPLWARPCEKTHLGLGGEAGVGFFLTNANNAGDIAKTTKTWTLSAGAFSAFGINVSWGGGVFVIEVTGGPGFGAHTGVYQSNSNGGTLHTDGTGLH